MPQRLNFLDRDHRDTAFLGSHGFSDTYTAHPPHATRNPLAASQRVSRSVEDKTRTVNQSRSWAIPERPTDRCALWSHGSAASPQSGCARPSLASPAPLLLFLLTDLGPGQPGNL